MRIRENFENAPLIQEAIDRNLISIKKDRITYNINQKKEYAWSDPEEWVRAWTISFLVLKKSYTPKSIRTEVVVPRRTPNIRLWKKTEDRYCFTRLPMGSHA